MLLFKKYLANDLWATVQGTEKRNQGIIVPALRQEINRRNLGAVVSMILPCGFSFSFFVTGAKEGAWALSLWAKRGVCAVRKEPEERR